MKDVNRLASELQDEHLDELIYLAYKYEDILISRHIANDETEEPLTAEEEQLANRVINTAWEKISQEDKAQKFDRMRRMPSFVFHRIIPIAACLILILNIAASVAVASNAYLRSKVMQLLISIDEERGSADLSFVEDDNLSFYVPIEWGGLYFPSDIPNGFRISSSDSWEEVYYEIHYTHPNGAMFSFEELSSGAGSSKGVENGIISYAVINGHTAMVVQSENSSYFEINWSTDDRWLVLQAVGLSYTECLQIAESVKRIIN